MSDIDKKMRDEAAQDILVNAYYNFDTFKENSKLPFDEAKKEVAAQYGEPEVEYIDAQGEIPTQIPGDTTGTIQGVTGLQGVTGAFGGPQGDTGLRGVTGAGVKGVTGFQGETGIQGLLGNTGVGIQGSTGVQGVQGNTGIAGIGFTGLQGMTGVNGVQGVQGATGFGVDVGNEIILGNPIEGFYNGIFPLNDESIVTSTFNSINSLLLAISPAAPDILSGNLTLSIVKYSAILPIGLNNAWYQNGVVAGSVINDYIILNSYSLSSQNPSTAFKVGSTFNGDEGVICHVLNGIEISTIDVIQGVGVSGSIQITSLVNYNTIWRKANARINYLDNNEGFKIHSIKYRTLVLNQNTNNTFVWYDDSDLMPVVSSVTISQATLNSSRYLSGVRYYSLTDTFNIAALIDNIANKTIRPVNPISYSMSGISSVNIAIDGSIFSYNAQYGLNRSITITNSNVYSIDSRLTVIGNKPSGKTASSLSGSANRLINTYSVNNSVNGDITMFDENYRFPMSTDFSLIPGSLTGNWNSSQLLVSGNVLLFGGVWRYPNINFSSYLPVQSVDYSGFTGDQFLVYAVNIANAHSSMRITFTGMNYTSISPEGSGDLNISIRLPSVTGWLDCGRNFGDGVGCRLGSSSGNILNLSFGTSSSSGSSGIVFIRITLKNSSVAQVSRMVILGT